MTNMANEHYEIELLKDEKLLMMEIVTEQYFGSKNDENNINNNNLNNKYEENTTFDNEEYFYKTGELCKEDKIKMIKLLSQEFFNNNHGITKSANKVPDNDTSLDHEDMALLLNIICNVKSKTVNEDKKFSGASRPIGNGAIHSIPNQVNSFTYLSTNEDQEFSMNKKESEESVNIFAGKSNDVKAKVERKSLNKSDYIVSPNLNEVEISKKSSTTISKTDRDTIVNLLNSFTERIVNEDICDIHDLPTRPNSKQSSPDRKLKKLDESKHLDNENRWELDSNSLDVEKQHINENKIAKNSYIKDIAVDIGKLDIITISQDVNEPLSNDVHEDPQLSNVNSKLLTFFEQKDSLLPHERVKNIEKGPNSNPISPRRTLKKRDPRKNLDHANKKKPDNNLLNIEKKHINENSTSKNSFIKGISLNIRKHDVETISQNLNDPSSDVVDPDLAKKKFLKFFEQKDKMSVYGVQKMRKKETQYAKKRVENIGKIPSGSISGVDDKNFSYNNEKESYHYQRHNVSGQFINKCIIDERIFKFSLYKTPMNDKDGPYYIDKDEVSIDIYQEGLVDGWNPTQVVFELCSQCQWQAPVFIQHDYLLNKGFHFGVSVNDCHFVPKSRGGNKKVAKHYASSFFLNFLGFKFRFNDNQQLTLHSTPLYNNHDIEKYIPIQFKDTLENKNYPEKCIITENLNNSYINTKQNYNTRKTQKISDQGHKSRHETHFSKTSFIMKTNNSQCNCNERTKPPYQNNPTPTRSIFTRVMHELTLMKKDHEMHPTEKDDIMYSNSSYNNNFNQEHYKKDKNGHKNKGMRNLDRSNSYCCHKMDFNHHKISIKEKKMKRCDRSSSMSSSDVRFDNEIYGKEHNKITTKINKHEMKQMMKYIRSSSNLSYDINHSQESYIIDDKERKKRKYIKESDGSSSDSQYYMKFNQGKHKKRKKKKTTKREISASSSSYEIFINKENKCIKIQKTI